MSNRNVPDQIVFATYNILADCYIGHEHFNRLHPEVREPHKRHPRIVSRVLGLNADVICLQEVEYAMFQKLDAVLSSKGYYGRWAHRGKQKLDGMATFVRRQFAWTQTQVHVLEDGKHVTQLAFLSWGDYPFAVANCHVVWDKPGITFAQMTGLRQVKQILSASSRHFPPTVICGDFNAQPDSLPVQEVLKAKYAMVHPPEVMTNWGPNPLRLDHIFCPLAMEGEPLLQHTPQTPFTNGLGTPSLEEPSDHLPIVAVLKPRK